MSLVMLTDHNTLEGALRIAHRPGTFLSVEVTTGFPADDVPLHVLVWNLTEEDHRDLQAYRPSVYELVAFLASRGLNGETGLLVPPDDPPVPCPRHDSLARSPQLRSDLGTAGRASALEWTWKRSFEQLLDAYRAAAGAVEPASAPLAA